MVSPSDRQSGELFKKVISWLDRVPEKLPIRKQTARELDIGGSRIVSLPSSAHTIRGFSAVNLLIEDEAAFVDDALHEAVTPMLAVSNGNMVLMSTPNGQRGHFYRHWLEGGDDWYRITSSAYGDKRISKEFLDTERRAKGEAQFRQEYLCEFLAASIGLVYKRFSSTKNVVDTAPTTNHHIIGVDYGYTDDCAFTVMGWRDHDPRVFVLESWKEPNMIPSRAAEAVQQLEERYKAIRVVGDISGLGKGYAEEARWRFHLPIDPAEKHNKNGYISLMNDVLERGHLLLVRGRTQQLQDEWHDLVWHESLPKEEPSRPNHCADSALYAWRAARAFLEIPAVEKPKPGTDRFFKEIEDRMMDHADRDVERDNAPRDEWETDFS
jgi:hypothetical protein